jgi:hypothetical protein
MRRISIVQLKAVAGGGTARDSLRGDGMAASRSIASAVLAALLVAATTGTALDVSPAFPPRLERYLTEGVRLTEAQKRQLVAGAPVTKLLDVDEGKEVAIFGAIWIEAPIRRYVEAVTDIETFERGGSFKVTKRISSPPRLEDFADLHLREEDVKDLRACRVGDCVVKLDAQAIEKLRAEVDWTSPGAATAVDRVMQQFALLYVNEYLEGGNERLAVYRDHSRPRFVAEEFRAMIDQMPELATYMPNLRRYLLDFPSPAPPEATAFLYWQETEFGLRPTIRISHLTIWETPDGTAVASKMLYASHYFWTGLELRALLADPSRGPGFWFVTVNRSRSDGLGGVTGRFVRGRARREVQKGTVAALRATKRVIEAAR